jgi:hypothetical protein
VASLFTGRSNANFLTRGDGDADGWSIVLLDEMDASADVLDLKGCDVIPACLSRS